MTFVPSFGNTRRVMPGFIGTEWTRPASGSFQATAAAVTTISAAAIPASANIVFEPANAAAGLLMRTKTCFIPTGNSAGSFTFQVSATGAGAPGGSETFAWFVTVENPS